MEEVDEFKASKYFESAAKKGHLMAKVHLGHLYYDGEGVGGSDKQKAESLYREAAMLGEPHAMTQLGSMYMSGVEGVLEKSDADAVKWLRKAGSNGMASHLLEEMEKEGRAGVPSNTEL